MAAPDEAVISVSGLTAAYGEAVVLENVSLDVRRGEVFFVAGGSGCGKSTLLKHMIGLLQPASGQVLIDGEDISTDGVVVDAQSCRLYRDEDGRLTGAPPEFSIATALKRARGRSNEGAG